MDFQKIKNFFRWLFHKKRKNSFHQQVQQEKRQKYLFNAEEDSYVSSRRKPRKMRSFQTNTHTNDIPTFSRFIGKYFYTSDGQKDLGHIMMAIGILLITLVTYIVIFSPYFRISPNKILVHAETQGVDTNIVYRAVEHIHGESIFTLNEKLIATKIRENLQNTASINITKLYPNGLKILIKSLPIDFDATIFGIDNKRWGISSNGVLVPLSDLKDENLQKHIKIISPELETELILNYKKVISTKIMFVIAKIFEVFENEWTDLRIAQANYFSVENELHITLESNTKIIFALQEETHSSTLAFSDNLLKQLVTLQTYIHTHRQKLAEWTIVYLDVRIPGKIFSCGDENQCKANLALIYGNAYR